MAKSAVWTINHEPTKIMRLKNKHHVKNVKRTSIFWSSKLFEKSISGCVNLLVVKSTTLYTVVL